MSTWRKYSDWAKHRPITLRVADYLGRGKGRLRVLDRLPAPPRAPVTPDLSNWEHRELAACWVGHATLLLRVGGMNILTDPVFSNRIGLGLGLMTGGPRRLVAPALPLRKLPKLDLVLISHAHFDHLDRPTLMKIDKRVPIVCARHTSDLVRDLRFQSVRELAWDQSFKINGLTVTAQPVKHWGARTFFDQHRGFNAYVIESHGRRVLFGGDTAYHDGFKSIGSMDLAILGIGAYDPYIAAHASPEQSWEMAGHVNAGAMIPIHHSTFRLSHEPLREPMTRLLRAAGSERARLGITQIGQSWHAGISPPARA